MQMCIDVRPPDADPSPSPWLAWDPWIDDAEIAHERLDLIVVPTARSLSGDLPGLALALEIATKFSARLVVLCSKDAQADDFPWAHARAMGLSGPEQEPWVVDFDAIRQEWRPRFASARTSIAMRRPVDTGAKRNLGLMIAKSIDAQSVLFLDDDIKPALQGPTMTTRSLAHALHTLRSTPNLRAIGWTAREQADNSVACHLRRVAGLDQDIFLGGGALLVKTTGDLPFFPEAIYNEDWLFMMGLCASAPDHRGALGWAGDVHQSASPIYVAERAQAEEPGDLIGEGLMNLLEDLGSAFLDRADRQFWLDARRERMDMLRMLRALLRHHRVHLAPAQYRKAELGALKAAIDACRMMTPEELARHVSAFRADEEIWSTSLRESAQHDIHSLIAPATAH